MKAIFFDSQATLLAKNLLPVADLLNSKYDNFSALFISAEIASIDPKIEKESIEKIKSRQNYDFMQFKSFSGNKIRNLLINKNSDIFFIDCYRIIDQLWVGIANSLRIKTYMLQHGFEIDSVHYKLFSIFTKLRKGLRLTSAAYHLSKILRVSFITLFFQYFRYIYFGMPLKDTFFSSESLHPSKVFIYSEYYKEFWNNKFGFSPERTEIVNYPDFSLIKPVINKKRETALCYITQSLVEDGRMRKDKFLNLMEEYKMLAKNVDKFVIKLHPRSNLALYKSLKGLDNVEITREFPYCTAYFTHYSSMAFVAAYLTNTVILHELKGQPTPHIYKVAATDIVKYTSEILHVYNQSKNKDEIPLDIIRKKLYYYAAFDEIDTYEKIYKSLRVPIGDS